MTRNKTEPLPQRAEPADDYKLPVGRAVGQGYLYVSRDLGLKQMFTGSVPLVSGEIAEDLAHYFTASEQTPSAVSLGVLVDQDLSIRSPGGWLVQMMPGADEGVAAVVEANAQVMPPVSLLVDEGASPEGMVERLLQGLDYQIVVSVPLTFRCSCTTEKVETILLSLGLDELRNMLREDGEASVRCHFCGK